MRASLPLLCAILILAGCADPEPPTLGLYPAIQAGDLDQIKRHLHHGSDIEQPDPEGRRPLHLAARQGSAVVTELLLERGAQPDARDRQGRTPLEEALLAGKVQVARLLVQRGATFDRQALLFEVARGNVHHREVVEFLVQAGAQVNERDASGQTALHIAVAVDGRLLVKRLIDEGADVNLPTADGLTPLAMARQAGLHDIAELLRRHGALDRP